MDVLKFANIVLNVWWSSEETSKRRFQRIRDFKVVERALHIPIRDRVLNCKPSLKLVLVIIVLGTIVTCFHSPAVHISDHPLKGSRYAVSFT